MLFCTYVRDSDCMSGIFVCFHTYTYVHMHRLFIILMDSLPVMELRSTQFMTIHMYTFM